MVQRRRPLGLSLLLIAPFVLACGDDSDGTDPGGRDSGSSRDGGQAGVDGGLDSGTGTDAGTDAAIDGGVEIFPELTVQAVGSSAEDLGRSAIGGVGGQLSGDGSCYVFESGETGVAQSGAIGTQVYLLDNATNAIEIVSVDSSGVPATRGDLPMTLLGTYVSDDCRYVVFSSRDALSTAPGDSESYTGPKVYLRDRMAETTTLLSFLPGPGVTSGCELASMNADGTSVAFQCNIEGRNNAFTNPRELYLWTRDSGTARYVDVKQLGGAELTQPFDTNAAFLAPNGRYLFSETDGSRLGLGSGRTWIRIDTTDDSWVELPLQDPGVTDRLGFPWMTVDGDGTEVLYATVAQVLESTEPNGAHLYLLDIAESTRTVITAEMPGMPTNRVSADHAKLSRDGRYVVLELGDLGFADGETDYTREAAVLWDRDEDSWTVLSRWLRGPESFLGRPNAGGAPSIAADGSSAIFRCAAESARNEPPSNWVELCLWTRP